MYDDEVLKAREDELIENLNYFLRRYNRLIALGFRKSELDAEISLIEEELKRISRRI